MKKRIIATVLVVAMLVLCTACAGNKQAASDDKEEITLRLANSNTENHIGHLICVHFAELVEEKSDGRIKIDIYPNKQLGDDGDVIEQMISGSLDMVMVSGVLFGNYSDSCNAWQLPFVVEDEEHFRKVAKSEEAQAIRDGLREVGIQGLANYTSYFRSVCSSGPVNGYEDCKDMKIRTAESEMLLEAWAAMGFSPTPMAFGEVYTGLQNGVIDATETDPVGLVNDGYGEVCKYCLETKHYAWSFLHAINPDVFDSLSEEDQNILLEAAEETVDYNVDYVIETTEEYIEKAKESGVTFVTPSEEDIAYFQETVAPVVDKYCDMDPLIADYVKFANSTSTR